MANTPTLTVNGLEVPHWSDVSIDQTIDGLADTFNVNYRLHSQSPAGSPNPLTFDGDEPVVLALDGLAMVTGYIDHAETEISTEGATVSFSGYSKTADLVSCAVQPKPLRWKDKTILFICQELASPFGIDVEFDDAVADEVNTELVTFKADFGETLADVIRRAANYKGLLSFSTADGNLRLARASTTRIATILENPGNIQRIRITRDSRDRFSDYWVTSPGAGRFAPDASGKDGKVARVQDKGVARYRPSVISAEQDVRTQEQRLAQGEWERNRRAGESLGVSIEFPMWEHSEGLWAANQLVRVVVDRGALQLDLDMLVSTVAFSRDATTPSVQLELVHPNSVTPREIPLPRKSKARAKATEPGAPEFLDLDDQGFDEGSPYGTEQGEDTELNPW